MVGTLVYGLTAILLGSVLVSFLAVILSKANQILAHPDRLERAQNDLRFIKSFTLTSVVLAGFLGVVLAQFFALKH